MAELQAERTWAADNIEFHLEPLRIVVEKIRLGDMQGAHARLQHALTELREALSVVEAGMKVQDQLGHILDGL